MTVMIIGDSPVLAQSLESGGIEATYLNYTHSRSLKDKGFPVLARPWQGADPLPRPAPRRPAAALSESASANCRFANAWLG